MTSTEIVTGILIALGAGVMLLSLAGTKQLLQLLAGSKYFQNWRILFALMAFFFVGYLITLVLVLVEGTSFFVILTGIIFFFGALFVYLVAWIGRHTIQDLLQTTVSKNYNDNILNAMMNALIVVSPEATIKTINQALCDLLGYRAEELIDQPISLILNKEGLFGENFEILTAKGFIRNLETTFFAKNATSIPVLFSGSVIYEPNDTRLQGIVCIAQDITERKQAERALALARDQALESSRLKTELLAKVSHELRTPLGAILGFAEMLKVGIYDPISTKQQAVTNEIIDSTHYLTSLVNELLDQAQLETGKVKLKLSAFSPTDIIEAALSRLDGMAQAKNLSLTTSTASDLPASLYGDPARVQQILVNLVDNALKFTHRGAIQIYLYQPDPNHWALQVSDTGPGIPLEAQTYIFEPFRQVDGSMTREQTGTGLGLSIVKQLTTLMGGQITLISEVGHGSVFTVFLPLIPPEEKLA